jgi:cobalt-zinc-cadmium efflux system outer membrane protein
MTLLLPILLSAAVAPYVPVTSRCGRIAATAVESTNPDDPSVELTLGHALELVSGDSPRSLALRAQVGEAKADAVAARVLPNPALDYAGTRLSSGTNTGAAAEDAWSIEWPLFVFGQRHARSRAAAAGVAATEAHVDAELAERALAVRIAYGELLSQQERTRILEEERSDLERVAKIVTGRRDAGEASAYDSLRVQTEFRSMDALLGDARGDLADARGRLALLLGCPGLQPRAVGELKLGDAAPPDLEALWAIASTRLPALAAAQKDTEAASAAASAARRDAWPVPVLSGGAVLTRDAQSTSSVVGVSIPLPVLDRNQGAIARARAKEEEAALERKALEAETRADLERAVAVANERRAALAELDAAVSSRVPEMRSMAESAYREGRGGILELLDAFRSLVATRLARVDAFAGAAHAETELLFLTGRATDPGP